MPFPNFHGIFKFIYWILCAFLYINLIPSTEELFYRVFQANQWKGILADIMISVGNTILNFTIYYFMIKDIWACLAATGLTFFTSILLVIIRDIFGPVECITSRIGITIGVVFWFTFISELVLTGLKRQEPKHFHLSDPENLLSNPRFSICKLNNKE